MLCATTGACDRISALLDGKPAEGEAKTDTKGETKADAKGDTKAETKAEAAPTKAGDAPASPTTPTAAAAAPPTAVAAAPTAPPTEAAVAPAAAGAPPCIVGRWRAIEYLAEVRRAIAKDPTLAKMKRTSSGGLLGYEVGAATDGKGSVKSKAEGLKYVFSGKVEGFAVTLTFTLDGEAEAAYKLEGDNLIVIGKPSHDTFKARASAKVEGFSKFSKSPKVDHEFAGSYIYECTEKTLKVWRNTKSGEALDFERET